MKLFREHKPVESKKYHTKYPGKPLDPRNEDAPCVCVVFCIEDIYKQYPAAAEWGLVTNSP